MLAHINIIGITLYAPCANTAMYNVVIFTHSGRTTSRVYKCQLHYSIRLIMYYIVLSQKKDTVRGGDDILPQLYGGVRHVHIFGYYYIPYFFC